MDRDIQLIIGLYGALAGAFLGADPIPCFVTAAILNFWLYVRAENGRGDVEDEP